MARSSNASRFYANYSDRFVELNTAAAELIREIDMSQRDDHSLRVFAQWIRANVKSDDDAKRFLVPAFAVAREAARRVLGLAAYDCQLLGAIALFEGRLVEMRTGEGKTLSAVIAAVLHALMGHRVHILTFNDYLVKRDCEWMAGVFEMLGISVGYIVTDTPREARRELYERDVLYITMKECGFDYLRDFLAERKEDIVQSRFQYAIVDEADSILIDEARVPLVIAGDVEYNDNIVKQAAKLSKRLLEGTHFKIDQFTSNVSLTEKGITVVERILGIENLYGEDNMETLDCICNALKAEHTLKIDKDYIVKDGQLLLIDEFTGRVVENRHYPDGLQAAVEVKEGLPTQSAGMVLSQITIQYFTQMYHSIAGMTGTAMTSASEFDKMYGLSVIAIPPNRPLIRKDREDSVYQTRDSKMRAVIVETVNIHKSGRPVLIGTSTVEESEWLADELRRSGVFTQVLNAKHDENEAQIIAKAGRLGAVTVSTNMAGRGVDIKLGGDNEKNAAKIAELGGLFVIGTNHYESRRIDNQLRGRAGRQGDPGESHFFCSLEDELMVKFGLKKLLPRYALQTYGSSQTIRDARVLAEIERVQRIAEGYYQDMRHQLSQYSSIIDDQRKDIHSRHYNILIGDAEPRLLSQNNPAKALRLQKAYGKDEVAKIEGQLILHFMNRCWAEYLEHMNDVRQGIHLVVVGGKTPLDEYRREAIQAYAHMYRQIEESVVEAFDTIVVNEDGIDLEKSNLKGPTSTWTYLIDESADQFSRLPEIFRRLTGIKADDDEDNDELDDE